MMGAAVRAASAPVPVVPSQNGQPDLALNRVSPKSLGGPGSADIFPGQTTAQLHRQAGVILAHRL
jgi:hypothetical protein